MIWTVSENENGGNGGHDLSGGHESENENENGGNESCKEHRDKKREKLAQTFGNEREQTNERSNTNHGEHKRSSGAHLRLKKQKKHARKGKKRGRKEDEKHEGHKQREKKRPAGS
jgi:hypothetical protein